MLASLVYTLCAITSLLCAALLWRGFMKSRSKVLFWSGLCFSGLMVSNAVLVMDKLIYTEIDLLPLRLWITLISLLALLFGLIYSNE
jgi:hypothetical protein